MENIEVMSLQDFVQQTMIEIMEGVKKAATDPRAPKAEEGDLAGFNRTIEGSSIDFDLAVTVSQSNQSEGGLKVSVLGIGVEAGGSKSAETQSEHRVKFSVPVTFPTQTRSRYIEGPVAPGSAKS